MSQIRITVGAARDRSVDDVFNNIANTAKRAHAAVTASAKRSANEEAAAWKAAQRELAKYEKERTDDVKRQTKERLAAEKNALREQEREAKRSAKAVADAQREATREWARDQERTRREELQAQKKLARDIENEQKKSQQSRSAMISGAIGLGGRALRFGASVVGDLARATGVKTDLSSHFSANADLETAAVNLSNAGYMQGDVRNGQRVDPEELKKFAFEKGNATGMQANDVVGALGAFVSKTGDLKTGMEAFEKMAILARATGSDVTDMADAMADVSNNLGDVPNKAEVLNAVMRQIAGQGKLGAVEVKDLATQMAKVASAASSLEGDAAKNIGELGAFAQEARQRGGAASAAEAATSVVGMINTLKTPARVNAFKAQGINVYNDKGQIRDPKAILMEALAKAGTDPVAFKKMYANVSGARAVEGFAGIYRKAYAGASGTEDEKKAAAAAAVEAEFQRLQRATLDETEMMESFHRSMNTGQAQANVFNNEMQQATAQMQSAVTPALKEFAPALVSATKAASDLMVKLFGAQGSKEGATDKAVAAADTDLAATNKQVAGGVILQGQNEKNIADAKALQNAVDAQKADAEQKAQAGFFDRALIGGVGGIYEDLTDSSKTTGQKVTGLFAGGGAAYQGFKKYSKMNAENAANDSADAANQEEHLKQLNDTNKQVADMLKNGTLKVQVVNTPAAAPKASGATVSQLGE